MERWEAKVIALVVTLVIPFVFTIIPYWVSPWIVSKGAKGKRMLCYLMCFGGGIFFGTFLLHLAPEVREILDTTLLDPNGITYPVTDLIIGIGFFFVLYLEKIVMRINKRQTQKRALKMQQNCLFLRSQQNGQCAQVCSGCKEGKKCLGMVNGALQSDDVEVVMISVRVKEIEDARSVTEKSVDKEDGCNSPVAEERFSPAEEKNQESTLKREPESIDKHSHHEHDDYDDDAGHHNMRSLILMIALSLHHIFEGLTIGLQHSAQRVFTLLVAVMCHEMIISFSLGLRFVKCKYSFKRMLITTICCSIIMPIGVAIGMIMSEVGAESVEVDMASGIVQAFACGTFIFVTFFEILQEEIDPHDTSIGKVTGAALGFVTMSLLTLIPEEPKQDNTDTTTETVLQNFTAAYTTFSP